MSDAMECSWKTLFLLLYKNQLPDDELPPMWAQFKNEHLQRSDIERAIESVKRHLQESEKEELDRICSDESANDAASLLDLMANCTRLHGDIWHRLFAVIRDRKSGPIGTDTEVNILEGGQTSLTTIQLKAEEKLRFEHPGIFTSQTSIPDQMIHEDQIDAQFNAESFRGTLNYEKKRSQAQKTLAKDNSKWNPAEVEKQASAQAKKETKQSKENELIKSRVAMEAEYKVQKQIEMAMKEYNIPALVLRGVNTYKDIGQFLEHYGIKVSRLKAFACNCNKGKCKCTLECEHDIVTLALLPTGPQVCFTQVKMMIMLDRQLIQRILETLPEAQRTQKLTP